MKNIVEQILEKRRDFQNKSYVAPEYIILSKNERKMLDGYFVSEKDKRDCSESFGRKIAGMKIIPAELTIIGNFEQ